MAIAGTQDIIAQVLLKVQEAAQQWQNFARAGTTAFKEVAVACRQATTQINTNLATVNTSLAKTQGGMQNLAKAGRSLTTGLTALSVGLGFLGRRALDASESAEEAARRTEAWDKALKPLGDSIERVLSLLLPLVQEFGKFWKSLSKDTQDKIVMAAMGLMAVAAALQILWPLVIGLSPLVTGLGRAFFFVIEVLAGLATPVALAIRLFSTFAGALLGEVLPALGTVLLALVDWPVVIAAAVGAAFGALIFYWDDVMAALMNAQRAIESFLKDSWASIIGYIQAQWDSFTGWFQGRVDAMLGWLDGLISKAKTAWAWLQKVTGQEGSVAPGFATGGKTQGGLAFLHPNEFVLRANAVRKYGLQFLYALNAGMIPAFANGGVMAPRGLSFAHAGASSPGSARRPITLNINGETFAGLLAPETIANKLIHFARKTQTLSGGKKPDWYK